MWKKARKIREDKRKKSRSKRAETEGEGEGWIEENGSKREDIGDTGLYLEGEEISLWKKKYEGKKEKDRLGRIYIYICVK